MNKHEDIQKLCSLHSNLSALDISQIIKTAEAIDVLLDSYGCDVFIDVPSKIENEAIVVYHGMSKRDSLYKQSAVGKKALCENEPGVLRTMKTGEHSKNIKAKTQENRYVTQDIYPIRNDSKVIGTLIKERDIGYDIQHNFQVESDQYPGLSSTLMSIKNINDNLDDAILLFDKEGVLQFKNVKADILYKSIGHADDIQGRHYDEIALDETTFAMIVAERYHDDQEIKIGNQYFYIKKIFVHEGNLSLAIILHDITQIKDKEAEIVLKTVAIREIHHRIKNNLQTIASLLRLQGRRTESNEAKILLKDSVNRILSIAATHELLSKQLSDDVNLSDVVKFVINNLRRCYSDHDHITLTIHADAELIIDSDRATVVALIVNELVQNCYDHAFKGKDTGIISVSLEKRDNQVFIAVKDNGKGLQKKEGKEQSLGLTIVQSYVKDKLKGCLSIKANDEGTNITVQFNL
ncbi:sensor histidine kinase [Microbacteriaceae bacterium 4G12]